MRLNRAGFIFTVTLLLLWGMLPSEVKSADDTSEDAAIQQQSPSIQISKPEIKSGEWIHFNDYITGTDKATWFVNGERIRGFDPNYHFEKNGLYNIRVVAFDNDNNRTITGFDLFVGEEIVKASDLISWMGTATTVRTGSERVDAVELNPKAKNRPVIVRVRNLFTPGFRLVFDQQAAGKFRFIELREVTPEQWQWVLGHVVKGRETILASQPAEMFDGLRELKMELMPMREKAQVSIGRKLLFRHTRIQYQGGAVAMIPNGDPAHYDIIISQPKR